MKRTSCLSLTGIIIFLILLPVKNILNNIHRIIIASLLLCLCACGGDNSRQPVSAKKEWTILFYTCEANNLEDYAFKDLAKLLASRIENDAVTVHIMMNTKTYGSWRITIEGNSSGTNSVNMLQIEDPDMSDMRNLIHFIRESVTASPARRYALIFQGHGSGWYLNMEEDKSVSVAKIAQAIEQTGVHFEILGFDMCLMAGMETIWELRKIARYIIACEDYGPWEGLVDPGLLREFSTEADTYNILKFMSDHFISRNEVDENDDPADMSIIATSPVEEMSSFLETHENAFLSIANLFGSQYAIDRSGYNQLQDLYSLAQEAFADDADAWENFAELYSNMVIHYQQNKKKKEQSYAGFHHGLSMVVNGDTDDYDTWKTYQELSFPVRLSTVH